MTYPPPPSSVFTPITPVLYILCKKNRMNAALWALNNEKNMCVQMSVNICVRPNRPKQTPWTKRTSWRYVNGTSISFGWQSPVTFGSHSTRIFPSNPYDTGWGSRLEECLGTATCSSMIGSCCSFNAGWFAVMPDGSSRARVDHKRRHLSS